jgi:hypothetical protein
MFAASGEVDKFIRGLNNGTIKILPEANNIFVDDSSGNKQRLTKKLADAIKEYEYSSGMLTAPPTTTVTLARQPLVRPFHMALLNSAKAKRNKG